MVRAWMAPPTNPGQAMVDDLIGRVRARSIAQESDLSLAVDEGGSDGSAGRLAKAVALIEALADTLAEDPDIVARHEFSLQNLDLALQNLQPLSAATLR